MKCCLCDQPAVLWCHNDEAALCEACDRSVHAVGPLAWKHKRVRLVEENAAAEVKTMPSDTCAGDPIPVGNKRDRDSSQVCYCIAVCVARIMPFHEVYAFVRKGPVGFSVTI